MKNPEKWTVTGIRALKGRERFACLTATDAAFARLLDEAGIPMILVGDSLGMTTLGYETTLPVTLEHMLHHTSAVTRGGRRALVVADLPFLTYQVSAAQALNNAGRFLQEAGADAVKLEGGVMRAETVRTLVMNGIPVMGHIGLLPQSVRALGGYRIQGRLPDEAEQILADARALTEAGIFALVIEGVPVALAARITAEVSVPTIGIGAGPACDGQVLVLHDVLGLTPRAPSFAKRYADLGTVIRTACIAFREDVARGAFPPAASTPPATRD